MPRPKREIPWVEPRDNGVHYVCWYDAGARRTRRKSLGTTDPVLAQGRFAAFLAEGGDIINGSRAEGLSVHAALDQYKSEHVDENCAAAERQRFAIERLKGFFGRDVSITDIDIPMSRAYARWRVRDGATTRGRHAKSVLPPTAATIRRELNVLVAAANHAAEWRRIRKDQVPSVELPQVAKKRVNVLAPAQVQALIKSADGRMRSFIVLAYFTAARREAIRNLTVPQVDLKRRLLHLHPDGAFQTIKRKATVPVNDACVAELRMLVEAAGADDRLFPETFDAYRRFKTLCRRLGLEGHPHVLRHSRATHLLQAGQDIYKVARLLGDSVATVERTYGHSSAAFEATAVTPFDGEMV